MWWEEWIWRWCGLNRLLHDLLFFLHIFALAFQYQHCYNDLMFHYINEHNESERKLDSCTIEMINLPTITNWREFDSNDIDKIMASKISLTLGTTGTSGTHLEAKLFRISYLAGTEMAVRCNFLVTSISFLASSHLHSICDLFPY